jgi:hypothetical protein
MGVFCEWVLFLFNFPRGYILFPQQAGVWLQERARSALYLALPKR